VSWPRGVDHHLAKRAHDGWITPGKVFMGRENQRTAEVLKVLRLPLQDCCWMDQEISVCVEDSCEGSVG
jgi:hypothetical protein